MKSVLKHISMILLAGIMSLPSLAQSDTFKIELLPFNSKYYDDLAPIIMEDGILFCSNRKTSVFVDYKTTNDERLLDLFLVEKKDSLKWGRPRFISKDFNTIFNEGPATYHEESRTLYFTRNLSVDKKNKSGRNNFGIFSAKKSGDRWVNVKAFPYNNPSYHIAHPSISKDGKTLYFSSNMPGGEGRSDIYLSRFENGTWTEPENLGPVINSNRSELYPFIFGDSRLYYSSNNNSMGGLDIFFSNKAGDSWTQPIALDPPFNSRSDDFAYVRQQGSTSGYFTSDRGNNDDVYSFASLDPPEALIGCVQQVENSYCYLFYETGVMNLDTLPYIYEWELGDGTKKRGLSVEHCFAGPGDYVVQLNVIDTLVGEVLYNQATYQFTATREEQVYISCSDTSRVGERILFDETIDTYLPDFTIEEYYWKFDDNDNTSLASKPSFTYAASGTYDVYLKLTGTQTSTGEKREYCGIKRIVIERRKP